LVFRPTTALALTDIGTQNRWNLGFKISSILLSVRTQAAKYTDTHLNRTSLGSRAPRRMDATCTTVALGSWQTHVAVVLVSDRGTRWQREDNAIFRPRCDRPIVPFARTTVEMYADSRKLFVIVGHGITSDLYSMCLWLRTCDLCVATSRVTVHTRRGYVVVVVAPSPDGQREWIVIRRDVTISMAHHKPRTRLP